MLLNEITPFDLSDLKLNLDTKEKVEQWLIKQQIKDFYIHPDLTVDVGNNCDISQEELWEIPVKFGYINGDFRCTRNNLSSLTNFPSHVNGNLHCSYNFIRSLHNIHKQIKVINGNLETDENQTNILGIFFIEGIEKAYVANTFTKAFEIINRNLQYGKDVHKCQEELLEAGYSKLARF